MQSHRSRAIAALLITMFLWGSSAVFMRTLVTMIEPLMIAILAAVLLREKLTPYVFIGVALAIAGSVVLLWPDVTATTPSAVPMEGVIYLVICCAGWAIYTIVTKPLLDRHDSFTVTALTMIIAAPIMIGAASEPLPGLAARLDTRQWFEVVYLVMAAGLGGTMLWNYGAKHLSSTTAGTSLYLIPVVAVVCGALILDEPVTGYVIAGGLLMLAGVAAAQFGPALFGKR